MGTREVYEEKLRTGNLYHDPTINPGLGSPRCPRCLSLLNPSSNNGEWTITSVLHDFTAVIQSPLFDRRRFTEPFSNMQKLLLEQSVYLARLAGSGFGGMLSAIHGFNTGIPYVQKHVKGPKWLPFVIGLPPLLMFSATSAAFGGYVLPKFAQVTVTSYYAASSVSHYGISLLTRQIEEAHTSRAQCERFR